MVCNLSILFCVFFFFKQKTAYEMRISDWSSDVCSSDLDEAARERAGPIFGEARARFIAGSAAEGTPFRIDPARHDLCRRGVVDQSVNPDRRHAVSLGSIGDDLDGLQALKGAQALDAAKNAVARAVERRSEEHTAELQS